MFTSNTEDIRKYIGIKYNMGNYIKRSIEKISIIALQNPTAPGDTVDKTDRDIWKQEVGAYVKEIIS